MPPTHTDEGLVAAEQFAGAYRETAVLVLSQHVEAGYAEQLRGGGRHSGTVTC